MGRVSIDTVFRSARAMCPSHETSFEQTRLFKVLFRSFVGSGGFCAGFGLVLIFRGMSPRAGRRAVGPGKIGGFPRLERLLLRVGHRVQYQFLEAVGVSGRLPAEIWAKGKNCS